MSIIPAAILHNPTLANKTECLVTNGTGSFASLAINGGLGRKFHGLLIHSAIPPMDRLLTWHACVESINGQSLDARQWLQGTTVYRPNGERFLIQYQATPIPTWLYQVEGNLLRKELFMVPGQASTIIKYSLLAAPKNEIELSLKNFVHFRKAESFLEQFRPDDIAGWQLDEPRQCISYDRFNLKLGCQTGENKAHAKIEWPARTIENQVQDLLYPIELEDQGYPQRDCSLNVQNVLVKLSVGESCYMIGTLEDTWPNGEQQYQQTLAVTQRQYCDNPFANDLAHSALQLLADRESVKGKTILAGYPWFGDWGRDTMIALPGTTLVTGQYDIARSILKTFAHYINGGMLPNKFPDRSGEALKYNTIDATFWFFWAIQQYVEYSGDWSFVETELYDDLLSIIHDHKNGTRFGICIDDDGLISGGDKDTQLTWMDVKFDGHAVTPRFGKAVEINALWFNALNFTRECADRFNDNPSQYNSLILQIENSFQKTFWNTDVGYCYDYVANGESFDDLRSNQIIAVSLPYSPLNSEQQKQVFKAVYEHLYTPVGLRSLSPEHVDYKGQYYGALHERDIAYHQGTVWAWPMGPFIDAAMKVNGSKHFAAQLLTGMKQHFYYEAGIHGISEVFDGDAPFTARGCFNQAWSVAETLRVVEKYQLNVPG